MGRILPGAPLHGLLEQFYGTGITENKARWRSFGFLMLSIVVSLVAETGIDAIPL
jgi:hypothetical protein